MNIEVFSYSILASILGICIVFISLVLLSLLMVALKAVFGDREKKTPPASVSAAVSAVPRTPAVTAERRENADWIAAAVAVFVTGEETAGPRAEAWLPDVSGRPDPWMTRAAFDKKIG